MSNLTFDIIYKIYFKIDDYITACNFWLLCKHFTRNYMKHYSACYKHKFNILQNDLFTFLYLLPENTSVITNDSDVNFYELITTQFLNCNDKIVLKNDIGFIYKLYKNFFTCYIDDKYNLPCIIMLQGPFFINNLVIVSFKKNYIKIKPKYSNKIYGLRKCMKYYNRYNFSLVETQINILETN